MSIKSFFFSKWKVVERAHVVYSQEWIFTGKNCTEDVELIIEENQDGKRRAFIIQMSGRKKINLDYAEGYLRREKK